MYAIVEWELENTAKLTKETEKNTSEQSFCSEMLCTIEKSLDCKFRAKWKDDW